MINNDRIVPITAIDLISMYALILTVGGVGVTALDATTTDGQFILTTGGGTLICSEPVKNFEFAIKEGVHTATVYFVPAYDFSGIKSGLVTHTDGIVADGRTLYKALLEGGAVTITKVGC